MASDGVGAFLGAHLRLGLLVVGLVVGCGASPADSEATGPSCPAGYTACGEQCLDVTSDAQNCHAAKRLAQYDRAVRDSVDIQVSGPSPSHH